MSAGVVLLDYAPGDLRLVEQALTGAGADVTVTADYGMALAADGLVIAGAGAFEPGMRGLRRVRGPTIIGRRLAGSRPVLGIAAGHHLLYERCLEPGQEALGCGEWPGTVEPFAVPALSLTGWHHVDVPPGSQLFVGVEAERFYFGSSYGVRRWELVTNGRTRPPAVAWATCAEDRYVAAVENGPLWATQFHPEKSGDSGAVLLSNWVQRL